MSAHLGKAGHPARTTICHYPATLEEVTPQTEPKP
jgi:hypothetical protein